MYLNLCLAAVFFAVLAMRVREGLWSNALMFFNVMTAALLATNYFEPLADRIDRMAPTYTYLADFLTLWAAFCVAIIVLRVATDLVSRVKVRFRLPVDWAGGIFFACWTAWIMVCFTTFSLHTAPLARSPFGGTFYAEPNADVFFGLAPDRQWLAFVHTLSLDGSKVADGRQGSLARSLGENEPEGANIFDPQAEFILKYGASRAKFEKEPEIRTRSTR